MENVKSLAEIRLQATVLLDLAKASAGTQHGFANVADNPVTKRVSQERRECAR